jgi:hypothetical protein
MQTLIRNNFCSRIFQNYECDASNIEKIAQNLKKISFSEISTRFIDAMRNKNF